MKILYRLIFMLSLCSAAALSAQQEVSTDWAAQANSIFSPLDKSRVLDGILLDYGMEFTNVPAFNGTLTDSTYVNGGNIREIYNTLLMSRIRDVSAGFVTPQTFDSNWQQQRNSDYIALCGLYFKYGALADDALSSGKIQYTAGKFYDVSGQNPYVENKTFAIASPIESYTGYTVKVKLPQNTFYTNAASEIQKIEIDFQDGAGFKVLPADQITTASYTSEGIKTWTYKMTLNSGEILLAQSKIMISQGLQITNLDQLLLKAIPGGGNPPAQQSPYYSKTITASESFPGSIAGKAVLLIDDAGNDGIKKPLIVVTGFDMDKIMAPENLNGQYDFKSFKNKVFNSESVNLYNLITGSNPDLAGDQIYDIIYIKWQDGMDYIQNNAYVLEEVIKWVNEQKALNGSAEKNVIIGQSMGGLVSRYTLRNMEQNGVSHQTRLFVNQDGPQQGANIPLAYQAAYRHVRNMYAGSTVPLFAGQVVVPLAGGTPWSTYFSVLDQPATRQLLKNRLTVNYSLENSLYTTFQTELQSKGYPVNEGIRNIAISNGSECGNTQTFNAGDKLLGFNYYKGLSFWGDLLSMVYNPLGGMWGGMILGNSGMIGAGFLGLVPGHSTYNADIYCNSISYSQGATMYHNKISYTKKILWIGPKVTVNIVNKNITQPNGVLPFDYYPGSYIDLKGYTGDLDPPIGTISGAYNFTIVPVPSALDLGSGNVILSDTDYKTSYNGANTPPAPRNTPFANFITGYNGVNSQNGNEYHLQFTKRNGDWLAAEINALSYTAGCSFLCSGVQISGETNFCTSAVYTVPAGAELYNWSVSGTTAITLSANGSPSITLTKTNNYNGPAILTVTLGDTAGKCELITLTKNIWIGSPTISITPNESTTNYVTVTADSGSANASLEEMGVPPTNVVWKRLDTGQTRTGYTYSAHAPGYNWSFDVEVKATNSCGTFTTHAQITPRLPDNDCETFTLVRSEEPNNYSVLKSVPPDCPIDPNNPWGRGEEQYQITVANSMGVIIISKTGDSFDLSSFPIGMYVVNIQKDNQVIINQTVIKN